MTQVLEQSKLSTSQNKKIVAFVAVIVASVVTAISFLSQADQGTSSSLTRVNAFRKIKVGEKVPGFTGSSNVSGKRIGPTDPPGKFYVHFVNDQLPPTCLDLECTEQAAEIVSKGGHLLGFSDGKIAGFWGVNVISKPTYSFDASVIVITNEESIITAIYKNVGFSDLPVIVDEIRH